MGAQPAAVRTHAGILRQKFVRHVHKYFFFRSKNIFDKNLCDIKWHVHAAHVIKNVSYGRCASIHFFVSCILCNPLSRYLIERRPH